MYYTNLYGVPPHDNGPIQWARGGVAARPDFGSVTGRVNHEGTTSSTSEIIFTHVTCLNVDRLIRTIMLSGLCLFVHISSFCKRVHT